MVRVLVYLLIALELAACGLQPATPPSAVAPTQQTEQTDSANLSGIKSYVISQNQQLVSATTELQAASQRYYALAQAANFDYAALWASQRSAVVRELEAARAAWKQASPAYEKMEGIVAGTPTLAQFDVDLDAGAAAADDPERAVSFDLQLADGRTLARPGNLFGVTEATLWGTDAAYGTQVTADWNDDGSIGFGETLPDAQILKASSDKLAAMAVDLGTSMNQWTPNESEAFTALVVMVPTMNEYFGSWKDSRFVAGELSTQRDFVAISRLADIQDILSGLEVVYTQIQPQVGRVDPVQAEQIGTSLKALRAFVADIYAQEQAGKRFTPEEADSLGAEAQNRATAITGQISQMAATLGITIAE